MLHIGKSQLLSRTAFGGVRMKSEPLVLVSDIGGSGTKTAVINQTGLIVASDWAPSHLYHPQPTWAEQDPNEILDSVVKTIRSCVSKLGDKAQDIEAVVFDGQQAGLLGIDERYCAVTPYDSWLDMRCTPYIDLMRNQAGALIFEENGVDSFMHGAKILWWRENRPDTFKLIRKFVIPSSYVGGKFAGLCSDDAYIEETNLTYSGIADIQASSWSTNICSKFDIPLSILPRVVSCTEIVGKLTKEYASQCGLKAGTPIVAGTGDFPAAGLGAGVASDKVAGDIAGTASLFFTWTDKFVRDPQRVLRPSKAPAGVGWYMYAFVSGGSCLRWFRDTFAEEEKQKAVVGDTSAYELLDAFAAETPAGSEGLFFVPHLAGRVFPHDPRLRGAWYGFSWGHHKGHFFRSILESIAYEYRFYLELMKSLGIDVKEVRTFGGGSRSKLWNQIKSDVLGVDVYTPVEKECTVLGSAVVGFCALGVYSNPREAVLKMVKVTPDVKPRCEEHKAYTRYYSGYRKIIELATQHANGLSGGCDERAESRER